MSKYSKDSKKRQKQPTNKGSLASRILLIALIFLVVPLVALVALLYREETRIKSSNNLFTLNVLIDQKEEFIKGIIRHELDYLNTVSLILQSSNGRDELLKQLALRDEVSNIFHLKENEEGVFIVDESADELYIGKDFSQLIKYAKEGLVFILDSEMPIFFLTLYDDSQKQGYVSVFKITDFLKNFPIQNRVFNLATTSIVSSDGKIVSSTITALIDKTLPFSKNGEILYGDNKYTTVQKGIAKTNFFLMLSAPKAINFVDIPFFIIKITVALIVIASIGAIAVFILTKKLSEPLKSLIEMIDHLSLGDLSPRYVRKKMGFEINVIGDVLNKTLDFLDQNMEQVQKERIERRAYEEELKIGEKVQHSILPKKVPTFPGLEMAALFKAAKEVGGDFYDFLVKDRLMVSIADTSGKGISACLYSFSVRSMLRSFGEQYHDLDIILKETNNLFCKDTGDSGMFVTAFVSFFDPKTNILEYANCGHFPALLMRKKGNIEKLDTKGMALGVVNFDKIETKKIKLNRGDILCMYTDGIVEMHNMENKLFGEERLIKSLRKNESLSCKKIVADVFEEAITHAEGVPQFDDLSIIAIRVEY